VRRSLVVLAAGVAAVLAARHPERVDRLVLVAALARSEPPWIFPAMQTPVVGDIALGIAANLAPPGAPSDYRARMALVSRIRGTRDALLRYVRRPGKFDELDAAYG
jgi:pimeloyl-ACP methyl ester carboxylesterase